MITPDRVKSPIRRWTAALAGALALAVCLAGCGRAGGVWPPRGWEREKYGSFSPDETTSFDGKYRAVQTLTRPEGASMDLIQVTVYDAESGAEADSFLAGRAWDFWGVCWEKDSYNLWLQSGDVGSYCMIYGDSVWREDEDREMAMPEGIIDRFRMEHGSFEYVNVRSHDGLYRAGRYSRRDAETGAWTERVEIQNAESEEVVFSFPLDEGECQGVCWEGDTYNLWVRLGGDSVCCLSRDGETWIRNDTRARPESVALRFNWDGTASR